MSLKQTNVIVFNSGSLDAFMGAVCFYHAYGDKTVFIPVDVDKTPDVLSFIVSAIKNAESLKGKSICVNIINLWHFYAIHFNARPDLTSFNCIEEPWEAVFWGGARPAGELIYTYILTQLQTKACDRLAKLSQYAAYPDLTDADLVHAYLNSKLTLNPAVFYSEINDPKYDHNYLTNARQDQHFMQMVYAEGKRLLTETKDFKPMSDLKLHITDRGHALMWNRDPLDEPLLTVEQYEKWYCFYLLMPDGAVKPLPVTEEIAAMDSIPFNTKIDHVWNPVLMDRIAAQNGYIVDLVARELVLGRWVSEGHTDLEDHLSTDYYELNNDDATTKAILEHIQDRLLPSHTGLIWHFRADMPGLRFARDTLPTFAALPETHRHWKDNNYQIQMTPISAG